MDDRRKANVNRAPAEADGKVPTWERVNLAVLMDIRDELQKLNRLLACENFISMPRVQKQIREGARAQEATWLTC